MSACVCIDGWIDRQRLYMVTMPNKKVYKSIHCVYNNTKRPSKAKGCTKNNSLILLKA